MCPCLGGKRTGLQHGNSPVAQGPPVAAQIGYGAIPGKCGCRRLAGVFFRAGSFSLQRAGVVWEQAVRGQHHPGSRGGAAAGRFCGAAAYFVRRRRTAIAWRPAPHVVG
ncbi:hypothetical protein DVDV_1341 [Desulfovibrio sp. DV]|nr:hypothetical protein DVDV_1341 [Desulfovibrio sp. DV]